MHAVLKASIVQLSIVLISIFWAQEINAQNIAINEIMASNSTTIADEDGDFEDWIELYNYGETAINLMGFGLSDDYDNPYRWVFPDITLEAGEFMLIWASGKNRNIPGEPLHTNFSISAAGEEIILTSPSSVLIDEHPSLPIPTDISYGRQPDGTGGWYYFDIPTPGNSNNSEAFSDILEPPAFSANGGWYQESFELTLSHEDEYVTIVFTLDGSTPCLENLDGTTYMYKNQYPQNPSDPLGDTLFHSFKSSVYNQGILIYDRSGETDKLSQIASTYHLNQYYFPETPVNKGMVVRAIALKPGTISSPVITNTYFVSENHKAHHLPVISIAVQEDVLFDYYDGIYVAGVDFDNWRLKTPNIPASGDSDANYHRRGFEWEHPAHIELYNPATGDLLFNQNFGLRLHGGWSRTYPLKSLRLYARNLYGNSTFDYNFFDEVSDYSFKRLMLRNSGTDFTRTMIRDAAIQKIVSDLNFDTQAYQPKIVYINGEFWGIHNLRERYDKHYLSRVYGVDDENLDILEDNAEIKEGDANHYISMIEYISNHDLSEDVHFENVKTLMDTQNYIDYQIAKIFVRDTDWPHNNIDFWRLRTEEYVPNAPTGHDGRWRWLFYDADFGFGYDGGSESFKHNTLAWATVANADIPPPWSTFLLRNLMYNQTFNQQFITRFADLLNTTFLPGRMVEIINTKKENIEPEMPDHIHRWNHPWSMWSWNAHINVMIEFAQQRPYYQRQHIREHFDIESDIDVSLDVNDTQAGYLRINTINITPDTPGVPEDPYPWTGIYFHNIPIEVEAIAHEGYAFSHWEGVENGDEALLQITPTDDISLIAHFTETEYVEPELLYFWLFDGNIPNNTSLEYLHATYEIPGEGIINYHSALEGYPFDSSHPNWRKASMERRNAPTDINYRPEGNNGIPYSVAGMRGMQVKQPFTGDAGENTLFFQMPTTGYQDIQFKFAAKDEGAADALIIDYSFTNGEPEWIHDGLEENVLTLFGDFLLYEIDFTGIDAVNDNPNFMVRMRFEGEDMATDDGDRVTFNNVSLEGVPAFAPLVYYSKPEGDLNNPTNWGSEPDGSGTMPPGFEADNTTYIIQNRDIATLDELWTVSGIGSMVILGDEINPTNLVLNDWLNADITVSNNATLTLNTADYPEITEAETGSTIVFTGQAHLIPYLSYHHLVMDNISPHFNGDGIVIIHGNINITGNVVMPDARDSDNRYDLMFAGDQDQAIATNGNVLRAYNMDFVKSNGSIAFAENSIISSDNQLGFFFGEDALFEDNGIVIYAGNSINIAGDADAYDFTGTLILAGTEEGIVKGSGDDNNFNIREGDNENPVAALNNIIIRVENSGGQFRFRDGSTDVFTIKGDLIAEAAADGRIRFYDNEVFIGGDIIIEEGFSGSIDPLLALHLDGTDEQHLQLALSLETDRLYIDNSAGLINLDGNKHVNELLVFTNGIVQIAETGLLSISPDGQMVGAGDGSFIDGTFGHYAEGVGNKQLEFPVGTGESYLPLWLDFASTVEDEVLYNARVGPFEDDTYELSGDIDHVLEDHMYFLDASGLSSMTDAMIRLSFDETGLLFDLELLRIAKLVDNTWVNLGGVLNANTIGSEEPFSLPAVFALAKVVDEIEIPEIIALQNITIPAGTDECFGATQSILLGGDGKTFVTKPGASVILTAGQHIIIQDHTHIKAGSYLHAHIEPDGPFCDVFPKHFLMAVLSGDANKDESLPAGDAVDDNPYDDFAFTAYPNPTTGTLHIELRGIATGTVAQVDIFNMMGEKLLHKTTTDTHLTLDVLSGNPAGVYLISVTHNKEVAYERVVKR